MSYGCFAFFFFFSPPVLLLSALFCGTNWATEPPEVTSVSALDRRIWKVKWIAMGVLTTDSIFEY